jgi:hypothetical protein
MATRYFTPDEANALLAEVRPAAEELVEHRRVMTEAAARRARFVHRIAGNGGDFDPGEAKEDAELFEREAEGAARCIERLEELGVLVKDADLGLVDFPALHDGEEVLLCWKAGEGEVAFWHGVDEGFAGRKPLPFE